MKHLISHYTRWKALSAVFLLLLAAQVLILMPKASAGTLTNTELRLDRLKTGTGTSFRVIFKAVSNQTANLSIDFNGTDTGASQWTNATPGGLVNGTQSVSTAQCVTDGYSALPGGSLTAAGSGAVVTVSSVGATATGSTYCVDLTSSTAVTNPTVAGQYHPTITIGTDSTSVSVNIISNDQISVNATVNPSFTFTLGSNSTSLTLTTSGVSSTPINATISTNAATGWQVWARDTAVSGPYGLKSTAATHTIQYSPAAGSSAAALTTGGSVEGFNMGIGSVSGTCNGSTSYASGYDNTANTSLKGGGLDSTLRSLATGGGTASSCALPLTFNAVSANTSPASNDYATVVSVVGAGLF